MNRFHRIALGLAAGTLAVAPAVAGKHDRAEDAIAQAQAKVESAGKVGGAEMPRLQADAEASLRQARESLKSGHKEEAFAQANHASQLADQAIGEAAKHRADAAQAQSDASVAAAQAQAADANARADAATAAAQSAQADAAAARAQPPVVAPVAQPTQVTTTETTTAHPARKRVVRTPATVTKKTTTTVSSGS